MKKVMLLARSCKISGFKNGDAKESLFDCPAGLAIDSKSNIYVIEYGNNRITKITPQGQISTFTEVYIDHGYGITVDKEDNVYTIDIQGIIHKISPTKQVTQLSSKFIME
jgi:DNA-binding beta-propeller fold protein YncE